jgi:hypothetical protein
VGQLGADIKTKPKQGLEMLGRLQAGAEIVAGEVTRAGED